MTKPPVPKADPRHTGHLGRSSVAGLLLLLVAACATPRPEATAVTTAAATAEAKKTYKYTPGKFDYYLLSLSWSPEYCAHARDDQRQCGPDAHYGVVVHGLWPQFDPGKPDPWPHDCAPAGVIPTDVMEATLPVMPSEHLIEHEWAKHGTCSGLGMTKYFGAIRTTFAKIKMPPLLDAPKQEGTTTLKELRDQFLRANPDLVKGGLTGEQLAVTCKRGSLSEIHVCLDRGFGARACGANVRDSCPATFTIAPVKGKVPVASRVSKGPLDGAAVRVHFIDVGQGAATLFEFSCAAVLVDTGGECSGGWSLDDAQKCHGPEPGDKPGFNGETVLISYLDAFFKRRPDLNRTLKLLVLTHPHIDHSLAVEAIGKQYEIENVITDGRTSGSGSVGQAWLQRTWSSGHKDHLRMISSSSKDDIPLDGLTDGVIDPVKCADVDPDIRVLWGSTKERPPCWTAKAFANENNHSVVLRVAAGKSSFLVSGDLELEGIGDLLDRYGEGTRLEAGVWVVGHHGSVNGTSEALLDAVKPELAVIEMGPSTRKGEWTAWAYGHPRERVVEDLLVKAVPTERTGAKDVQVASKVHNFVPFHLTKAIYGTGWDGTVIVSATQDGTYEVTIEKTDGMVAAPAGAGAGVAAR